MWRRFLCGFANVFVVSYAIDSAISVIHVCAQIGLGAHAVPSGLTGLRTAVASTVIGLAIVALPLLASTRRLIPSVFVPLVASTLWFATGSLPLPFVFDADHLDRLLTACQVGIAFAAWVRIRDLRGGAGGLLPIGWFDGPLYSHRYLAGYTLASVSAIIAFVFVSSVATLALALEQLTNGFIRFDSKGISMADRTYESTVDPLANPSDPTTRRRIRLIGMMHIGEEAAYRDLFRDLDDATPLSIVLMEGVSDLDGMVQERLSYRAFAEFLGVDEQRSIEDYVAPGIESSAGRPGGATFVNADVDISDFDPRTVDWLQQAGELYSGESGIVHLLEIYRELRSDPERAAVITNDIIVRRNRHLIRWIRASRINYREIIVPWGAMHLPGIESAIHEMGFERRRDDYVQLIGWGTLAHALFGNPETPSDVEEFEAAPNS